MPVVSNIKGKVRGSAGVYFFYSALAATLAFAQLVSLPIFLGPTELSIAALSFSATQAMIQFGDAGYANAASNRNLSSLKRRLFRIYGVSVAYLSGGTCIACLLILGLTRIVPATLAASLALGALTGTILMSTKMSALGAMQHGRERKSISLSFYWQNIPKPGQLVGSLLGSAVTTAIGGAVLAVAVARPLRVGPLRGFLSLPRFRRFWSPGLGIVATTFLMSWLDTYLVAGTLSLYEAGLYQAIYRPMLGATYVFLPAIGLIQANLNAGRRRRAAKVMMATILITIVVLLTVGSLLVSFGSQLWTRYQFPIGVIVPLGVAVLMYAVSTLFGTVLLVEGRVAGILLSAVAGAAVLAVLTVLLVPALGIVGASIAAAASWTFAAASQSTILMRRFRLIPSKRRMHRS